MGTAVGLAFPFIGTGQLFAFGPTDADVRFSKNFRSSMAESSIKVFVVAANQIMV